MGFLSSNLKQVLAAGLFATMLYCAGAVAQTPTQLESIQFSADGWVSLSSVPGGGVIGSSESIFEFNVVNSTAVVQKYLGDMEQAGIDGVAYAVAGCPQQRSFSVDTTAVLVPAVTKRQSDVFIPSAVNLLNASDGIPDGVNIDAFSYDPDTCNLVFSIDIVATIDGVVYKSGDLISWDGSDFDGWLLDEFDVNIDALHLIGNGRFLFSVDVDAHLGDLIARDDDVIESIPVGGIRANVLAFSPRIFDLVGGSWFGADLNALSATIKRENFIFRDSFED